MAISKITLITIGVSTGLLVGCSSLSKNYTGSSLNPSDSSSTAKVEPPKATLELPVPLDVVVDMNGKVSIQPRGNLKIPTPLGTIKLAVGGASVSLQDIQKIEKEHKDKRLLIVIVDDKASVYELGKGNKIDLDIEFNNKLFKKINIKNKINDGDESVIVKLVSVPNNLNASNSGAPSITSPPSICLTNDRTFVAAETQRFIVSICGQDNPTYYVGTAKGETDSIKLRLNSSSSGQHIAKNGNTSYIVERGYLTVLEDDRVLVKEKIIRSQWN